MIGKKVIAISADDELALAKIKRHVAVKSLSLMLGGSRTGAREQEQMAARVALPFLLYHGTLVSHKGLLT